MGRDEKERQILEKLSQGMHSNTYPETVILNKYGKLHLKYGVVINGRMMKRRYLRFAMQWLKKAEKYVTPKTESLTYKGKKYSAKKLLTRCQNIVKTILKTLNHYDNEQLDSIINRDKDINNKMDWKRFNLHEEFNRKAIVPILKSRKRSKDIRQLKYCVTNAQDCELMLEDMRTDFNTMFFINKNIVEPITNFELYNETTKDEPW